MKLIRKKSLILKKELLYEIKYFQNSIIFLKENIKIFNILAQEYNYVFLKKQYNLIFAFLTKDIINDFLEDNNKLYKETAKILFKEVGVKNLNEIKNNEHLIEIKKRRKS